MPTDYAWCFAGIGILGTVLGQTAVDWALKKYKKDAVVRIQMLVECLFLFLPLPTYSTVVHSMHKSGCCCCL